MVEAVIDSYSEAFFSNPAVINASWASAESCHAHSFTTPDGTFQLTKAKFYLKLNSGSTYNLTAHLYEHTGTYGAATGIPTGNPLANSDAVTTGLTGSYALVTFTFSGSQQKILSKNKHYCIAMRRNSGDGVIYLGMDITAPTHTGIESYWNGTTWVMDGDYDDNFYVYGEPCGGSTLLDSYPETNSGIAYSINDVHPSADADRSAVGQTFTTPDDDLNHVLTSCKFYLDKVLSPVAIFNAALYLHSGTYGTTGKPFGSALATSRNFQVSTLTTTPQLVTFTFRDGYEMTPNTHYCLVLQATSKTTLDGNNYVEVWNDGTAPTHSGNVVLYSNSVWTYTASYDLIFYVYGIAPRGIYTDVDNRFFNDIKSQFQKMCGATSMDVMLQTLSLGAQDATTGWYLLDYSGDTIEMVIQTSSLNKLGLITGWYASNNAVGYTQTFCRSGDRVFEQDINRYWTVVGVTPVTIGRRLYYYKVDLEELLAT